MKDRRGFKIINGFRHSSCTPTNRRAARTQEISSDRAEAIHCLLCGQVENGLAAALTASEQRLSALLHDRSRIGRELHDSVLQALYAIGLTLEQTPGLCREVPRAAPRDRDRAADQLHTLIQDIRCMIQRVESDSVDPFRLIFELQALARTVEQVSQVCVRVEVEQAAEEILTGEEARELVTISREALSNCVRHAQASCIVITLRRIGSRVRLSIRDNGSGFAVGHEPAKGMGFAQMEDRVRKIGGRLNINSTVGQGTCITADVYLEPILTTV